MEVSRRMMFAGAGLLTATLMASTSEACTLIGRRMVIGFSDAACRRSLRELVALINHAPTLSDDELSARADRLSIEFSDDVSNSLMNFPDVSPVDVLDLIRSWSSVDGKRDRSPITIREVNLLKGETGKALYQFTLRRDQYHAEVTEQDAENDNCGFLVPQPAFYASEDMSYLGLFLNNKLREVSAFDVWLRNV